MNDFDSIIKRMTVTRLEPGDYTGKDGLLYCGKCRTPKQFRMDVPPLEGRLLPHPCCCEQERLDREAAEQEARRHRQTVDNLKRKGFTDPAMREWTFANDNGKCPQMKHARFYVENWPTMQTENIGYLLWGGVGTGKSYFAGCIANALMEQEVAVRMTNFALILNDLTASFEGRNEYIARLCRARLLILEIWNGSVGLSTVGTGLQRVDSRYRSRRPLIVTRISLQDLQHPRTPPTPVSDDGCWRCALPSAFGENFPQGHGAGTSWHV